MTVLMGIDPGGMTGVAFKIDETYSTCTISDPKELWDLLKDFKPEHVAFETFATGGRVDVNMLHTIELVGSIHGICYVLGIPFYGQQPQARRSFLQKSQRMIAGYCYELRHESDALAHLLLLEYRMEKGLLQA